MLEMFFLMAVFYIYNFIYVAQQIYLQRLYLTRLKKGSKGIWDLSLGYMWP